MAYTKEKWFNFLDMIDDNNLIGMQNYIENDFKDVQLDMDEPLRIAVQYDRPEIVKLLLPLSNPEHEDNLCLRLAASHGFMGVVRILMDKNSNPMSGDGIVLIEATKKGQIDIVQNIIPYITEENFSQEARLAALYLSLKIGYQKIFDILFNLYGNEDIAKELITKSFGEDFEECMIRKVLPLTNHQDLSEILIHAIENDDLDWIDVFFRSSDVEKVMDHFLNNKKENESFTIFSNLYKIKKEKEFLEENLSKIKDGKAIKKRLM